MKKLLTALLAIMLALGCFAAFAETATTGLATLDGEWNSTYAEVNGDRFTPSQIVTLTVKGTSGMLYMGSEKGACDIVYSYAEDGTIIGCEVKDNSAATAYATVNAQGQLMLTINGTEGTVVLCMVREDAQAPAAAPAATDQSGFIGRWNAVSLSGMGATIAVKKGDIWIDIGTAEAEFFITESTFHHSVTINGDSLTLGEAGGSGYTGTINADGQLVLVMQDEDAYTLVFDREGGDVAPAASAAASTGFDGHWDAVSLTGMGMTVEADEGDIWLEIGSGKAEFYITGDTFNHSVTVNGDTMSLSTGNDESYTGTINADGQLVLVMKDSDSNISINFVRKGGAAVQTSAASTGFEGSWDVVYMKGADGGVSVPKGTIRAEFVGDKITMTINGKSYTNPYTVKDGVCTYYDNNDLYTAVMLPSGQMEMTMHGDDATLVMTLERDGSAAASTSASSTTSYDGKWRAKTVEAYGMSLNAADFNMAVGLTLDGGTARMTYDNDTRIVNCTYTVTSEGILLDDGKSTLLFSFTGDGRLKMEVSTEDMTMYLYFERE